MSWYTVHGTCGVGDEPNDENPLSHFGTDMRWEIGYSRRWFTFWARLMDEDLRRCASVAAIRGSWKRRRRSARSPPNTQATRDYCSITDQQSRKVHTNVTTALHLCCRSACQHRRRGSSLSQSITKRR